MTQPIKSHAIEETHAVSRPHRNPLLLIMLLVILLPLSGLKAQSPDPRFDDYLASVRELLPVDGTLLYDCSSMQGYSHWSQWPNRFEVFQVNEEVPFSQAWRATVTEIGDYWWNTGFITPPNTSAIEQGDLLFYVFYARTNQVDAHIGLAKASFAAQITGPPFTNIVQTFAYPQTGWTRFYLHTVAKDDYGPGDLQATMHFEFFPQIIEFGGFIALNLGQGVDPADLPPNTAMIDQRFDENLAALRELLPVEGTILFECNDLSRFIYYGHSPGNSFSMINTENENVPFSKAYRIQLNEFGETWEQLIWPSNQAPIQQGDMVLFSFYARSVVAQKETGSAFHAISGMSTPHWHPLATLEMTSPPEEWTQYYFFGRARIDHDTERLFTAIFFNAFPKIIDFGGFVVLNLGQGIEYTELPYNAITYVGREEDTPWREAARKRIEEHRKGDLTVSVVDKSGVPVIGADIAVEMKRHAFEFGTFPAWLFYLWDGPDGEMYQKQLLSLFNAATTGFYMGTDEWGWYAQPETRPFTIAMAQWLKKHQMNPLGHTLIWPGWFQIPPLFIELADDPLALHTALIHHLDTVVTVGRNAGVAMWDVINEPAGSHDLMDILGDEVIIDWFEHTHALHPEAELAINEAGIISGGGIPYVQDNLERLIKLLQDANAPIHRVGFQCHMGSYLPSPDEVFDILERYAAFGLNIHISEFDINADDEQAQADYTRDFLTIVFSHPSVDRFTTWGFWEATMYVPKGALFRTDWSKKPNYYAYTDLLFNQWWTEEGGQTNELGEYVVRGFLGDYKITVAKDHLSVKLDTVLTLEGTAVIMVLAETYQLDLDVHPFGAGVVAGAGEYISDRQLRITAEANPGWRFKNWTGDTGHIDHADSATAIVTMPASDVSLTAQFELIDVTEVSTLAELRAMPAGQTNYRYIGEAVIVAMPREPGSEPLMYSDFDDNQHVTFGGWPLLPTIVTNPDSTGINTSLKVGRWARSMDPIAHVSAELDGKLDFSRHNLFRVKIWSPIVCEVVFKVEDKTNHTIAFEVSQTVYDTRQWVELTYDFSGAESGLYDKIVIFMDYLSSQDNIFYFDDVTGPAYEGAGKTGSIAYASHEKKREKNTKRTFIQDETAAIYLFDAPGNMTAGYDLYDVVTNVTGQIEVQNNMVRFLPAQDSPEALANAPLEPSVYRLDEVTPDHQARLIKFNNAAFKGIRAGELFQGGQNYTITDGANNFVLRTLFLDEDYIGMEIPHGTLNITGVVTQLNNTMQITPRFAADLEVLPDLYGLTMNLDMRRASGFNPGSDQVYVTGSFGDPWPVPGTDPENQTMNRVGETMIWSKTYQLESGAYKYKYFLNDGWDHGEWAGEPNRFIDLEGDKMVYNAWGKMGEAFPVAFSIKNYHNHDITDAVITVNGFTYHAGEYEIGYLPAGDFDYQVHLDGYFEATGSFNISNEAVSVNVLMLVDDTAIQDPEHAGVKVFPNPVRSTLYIKSGVAMTGIQVFDMLGRPLLITTVDGTIGELDLSTLNQGIYLIKVFTVSELQTFRITLIKD